MSVYVSPDGGGEPTLWLQRPGSALGDEALARQCEVHPLVWALILAAPVPESVEGHTVIVEGPS